MRGINWLIYRCMHCKKACYIPNCGDMITYSGDAVPPVLVLIK